MNMETLDDDLRPEYDLKKLKSAPRRNKQKGTPMIQEPITDKPLVLINDNRESPPVNDAVLVYKTPKPKSKTTIEELDELTRQLTPYSDFAAECHAERVRGMLDRKKAR